MGFTPCGAGRNGPCRRRDRVVFPDYRCRPVIGRLFDREVILDRMDSKQKQRAEAQRRYREAHKEEIAEGKRRYREAHKEEIAEGKRELRDARIALGLTQKQAAELLGVAQPTVCLWETISPPKNWREMIAKMKEPA